MRDAVIMKLKPGAAEEYAKRHSEVWPELLESIKNHGAKNYSIYLNEATNELFSYLEVDDADAELWASRSKNIDEITKKWWAYMADLMEVNSDNSPVSIPIREVFHLD